MLCAVDGSFLLLYAVIYITLLAIVLKYNHFSFNKPQILIFIFFALTYVLQLSAIVHSIISKTNCAVDLISNILYLESNIIGAVTL